MVIIGSILWLSKSGSFLLFHNDNVIEIELIKIQQKPLKTYKTKPVESPAELALEAPIKTKASLPQKTIQKTTVIEPKLLSKQPTSFTTSMPEKKNR